MMKVGDLARYYKGGNILIVIKVDHDKKMLRCYCPRLQEHYWFNYGTLEAL
jgi:hypothetical protein